MICEHEQLTARHYLTFTVLLNPGTVCTEAEIQFISGFMVTAAEKDL